MAHWGKDFASIFQKIYYEITAFHAAHDYRFFADFLFQVSAKKRGCFEYFLRTLFLATNGLPLLLWPLFLHLSL